MPPWGHVYAMYWCVRGHVRGSFSHASCLLLTLLESLCLPFSLLINPFTNQTNQSIQDPDTWTLPHLQLKPEDDKLVDQYLVPMCWQGNISSFFWGRGRKRIRCQTHQLPPLTVTLTVSPIVTPYKTPYGYSVHSGAPSTWDSRPKSWEDFGICRWQSLGAVQVPNLHWNLVLCAWYVCMYVLCMNMYACMHVCMHACIHLQMKRNLDNFRSLWSPGSITMSPECMCDIKTRLVSSQKIFVLCESRHMTYYPLWKSA